MTLPQSRFRARVRARVRAHVRGRRPTWCFLLLFLCTVTLHPKIAYATDAIFGGEQPLTRSSSLSSSFLSPLLGRIINLTKRCLCDPPTTTPSVSDSPSETPSIESSLAPSVPGQSSRPSVAPSERPSPVDSDSPSERPSPVHSDSPSNDPSVLPSQSPSDSPSSSPSSVPSLPPSSVPSDVPSGSPSDVPSRFPSSAPSGSPTVSAGPTNKYHPSSNPTLSGRPSTVPSSDPSTLPSSIPSLDPTETPSSLPTTTPSSLPTTAPSKSPTYVEDLELHITVPGEMVMPLTTSLRKNEYESSLVDIAKVFEEVLEDIFNATECTVISIDGAVVDTSNKVSNATMVEMDGRTVKLALVVFECMHIHECNGGNCPFEEVESASSEAMDEIVAATTSGELNEKLETKAKEIGVVELQDLPEIISDSFTFKAAIPFVPSNHPSLGPTESPTAMPSSEPSKSPSISAAPSEEPSQSPSKEPSDTPSLSHSPSKEPSETPSLSQSPSDEPSETPSLSQSPSDEPSETPSLSQSPSDEPSETPSKNFFVRLREDPQIVDVETHHQLKVFLVLSDDYLEVQVYEEDCETESKLLEVQQSEDVDNGDEIHVNLSVDLLQNLIEQQGSHWTEDIEQTGGTTALCLKASLYDDDSKAREKMVKKMVFRIDVNKVVGLQVADVVTGVSESENINLDMDTTRVLAYRCDYDSFTPMEDSKPISNDDRLSVCAQVEDEDAAKVVAGFNEVTLQQGEYTFFKAVKEGGLVENEDLVKLSCSTDVGICRVSVQMIAIFFLADGDLLPVRVYGNARVGSSDDSDRGEEASGFDFVVELVEGGACDNVGRAIRSMMRFAT